MPMYISKTTYNLKLHKLFNKCYLKAKSSLNNFNLPKKNAIKDETCRLKSQSPP